MQFVFMHDLSYPMQRNKQFPAGFVEADRKSFLDLMQLSCREFKFFFKLAVPVMDMELVLQRVIIDFMQSHFQFFRLGP